MHQQESHVERPQHLSESNDSVRTIVLYSVAVGPVRSDVYGEVSS